MNGCHGCGQIYVYGYISQNKDFSMKKKKLENYYIFLKYVVKKML